MTANLLDRPVPPLPARFAPDAVPDLPGFVEMTDAFGSWAIGRPIIVPRVCITHTNAASVESSLAAAIRWGNSDPNRTKPHWNVNEGLAVKTLPTNRRSIANSTGRDLERLTGDRDCSFWTISIETRDSGTNADPNVSDFLGDDAEMVAIINAFESLIPGQEFPIEVAPTWNGAGVATHTWPYPYPHYTTARGKTCPGAKKKRTFREQIVPRAAQIRAEWVRQMNGEEPNMNNLIPSKPAAIRSSDTRVFPGAPVAAGSTHTFGVPADVPANATGVLATITAVQPAGSGFVTAWESGPQPIVSALNFDGSDRAESNTTLIPISGRRFQIFTSATTHLVVDIAGWIV